MVGSANPEALVSELFASLRFKTVKQGADGVGVLSAEHMTEYC